MTHEERTSSIISKLKQYKSNHPELTIKSIADSTGLSESTITRMFASDSENHSFSPYSIQAISEFLLEDENDDVALAIYRYNESYIKDLESQIAAEKEKRERKVEEVRESYGKTLSFMEGQIRKKDDRIDKLHNRVDELLDIIKEQHKLYEELHQNHLDLMNQLLTNKDLISKVLSKDNKGNQKG